MFFSSEVAVAEAVVWDGVGGEPAGETRCDDTGDVEHGRRRSVGPWGEVRPVEGRGAEVVTMVVLVRPGSEYGEYLWVGRGANKGPI